MGFSFFDRLFGREEEKPQPEIIESRELRSWLEEHVESGKDRAYNKCVSLVDDIFQNIQGVEAATRNLDKLECPTGIHKKAVKIVRTSKPRFVRGVLDALSALGRKPSGYDELKIFYSGLEDTMPILAKLNISEGRYLPMVFGERIDDIKKELKKLAKNTQELKKIIGSDVDLFLSVLETLDVIEENGNEKLDVMKQEMEEEIREYNKKIAGLEDELCSLHSSGEFKELGEAARKHREVVEELESVELQIFNLLNPLKRPLKKFRKFGEVHGFSQNMLKWVSRYIQDPVDCFLSDSGGNLEQILSEIKCGEFKIENKKIRERIESASVIDGNKIRNNHSQLLSLKGSLGGEIESSSVTQKEETIKREVERMGREIEKTQENICRLEKRKENAESRVVQLREEIEAKLSKAEGYLIKINW